MAFEGADTNIFLTVRTWWDHCREEVVKRMEEAWYAHGEPTKDPVRGALNLTEEVGEVAEAALDATRADAPLGYRLEHLEHMVFELGQVAGYAILLRCQIEGEIRRLRNGG